MRRHERQQTVELDRPLGLMEHAADQLGVHMAEHRHAVIDEVVEGARGEVDREPLLVHGGLEADIVEVLVEGVQLVGHRLVVGGRLEHHAPHQVAVALGILDALSRDGTRRLRPRRIEDVAGASAGAGVLRAAHDEPFGLQHPQVVPKGVLVQTRDGGEIGE